MKRFPLFWIVAALSLPQTGQAGWWRTYGDTDRDIGYCVKETSDGNYIICGYHKINNVGYRFIFKVDTSGNIIWSENYEGGFNRWLEEISDGYIVAAAYKGLIRTDSQGDSVWTKYLGMGAMCVQETSDGGYVVTGDQGDSPLVILKTDADGNTSWMKSCAIPGNNMNQGKFIRETPDGGFIVTGLTGFLNEYGGYTALWLLKTNADGDTVWTKKYGGLSGGDFSGGCCVRVTADSGYIISGYTLYNALWLLRVDSQGDSIWTKTYNSGNGGVGYSIQETLDGGYIITGGTGTWLGASYLSSEKYDPSNLWLLKTDSSGDTLWTRSYGGGNTEIGYCVQETNDMGYILTGFTTSFGAGDFDVYFLKTDSLGLLAVKEGKQPETQRNWVLSSNIGPVLTLKYFNASGGMKVFIFDPTGRKVDEINSAATSGTIQWGAGERSGVYFIVAEGSKANPTKVVLVR